MGNINVDKSYGGAVLLRGAGNFQILNICNSDFFEFIHFQLGNLQFGYLFSLIIFKIDIFNLEMFNFQMSNFHISTIQKFKNQQNHKLGHRPPNMFKDAPIFLVFLEVFW